MAVVGSSRFGDEQSSLLDEFERLSFEAHVTQLNKVMLGRSLSEPKLQNYSQSRLISVANHVMQGPTRRHHHHHHGRFHKILKKLLKPILGRKRSSGARKQQLSYNNKDILSFKAFSRSMRF